MLLAKCSNTCAACEICLQFCIACANESGHQIRLQSCYETLKTDLAIRIWTILVPIRLKKAKKNGFGPFSYKLFVPIRVGLTLDQQYNVGEKPTVIMYT